MLSSKPALPRGPPSPESSNVVAEVDDEPWADEVRLSGGDVPRGMLSNPSDPRAPVPAEMDLLSPLPFSRLGVREPMYLSEELPLTTLARLALGFTP